MAEKNAPLLRVTDLSLAIARGKKMTPIVQHVDFTVEHRGRFGLVGESGSGKSLTLRAIAGLLPPQIKVVNGKIEYEGHDLVTMDPTSRRKLMGSSIAMIFQEPMTALNPVMRVGEQIAETIRFHLNANRNDAKKQALGMMEKVGIPEPEKKYEQYPHQLSGGLRQRIMIAMALSCSPNILLCDEPTTALDVIVQDQVLQLIQTLCDGIDAAVVFVSHDLAVVSQLCDAVGVMQHGNLVEIGNTLDVFTRPQHPYTQHLLRALPIFERPDDALPAIEHAENQNQGVHNDI